MEKEYDNAKDMFKSFDEEFKRKHPVSYWVDNSIFRGKGLFGYAPHYSLTHPFVILSDFADEVKFAWQRVFRGWDDRAVWSIDFWLDDIMPDMLMKLKSESKGLPHFAFEGMDSDENGNYSDEQYSQAIIVWKNEIDKMANGFIASKMKEDVEFKTKKQYDAEMEKLETLRVEGMTSFVKHYNTLWD